MTKSPVASLILRMLKRNKKLSDEEARRCMPMVVTRIVGFIHNAVQVRGSACLSPMSVINHAALKFLHA